MALVITGRLLPEHLKLTNRLLNRLGILLLIGLSLHYGSITVEIIKGHSIDSDYYLFQRLRNSSFGYIIPSLIMFAFPLFFIPLNAFQKLRIKPWVVVSSALIINLGQLFEKLVIIITSIHRDYLPSSWGTLDNWIFYPIFNIHNVVCIALILIMEFIYRRKNTQLPSTT